MYLPGSIRQITLTNFITHGYVEVYPGPKLNMILGSNGSGKSSIVAAIILGLGGTPKTIGRGQQVSEYVKHNCNEAIIELKLQGNTDDDGLQITRKINIRDQTTWYINGEKTTLNAVKTFISKYNIQVDNLCQFLPQDRVADFAKMNKQELLKQTQIALCREDLLQMQEKLIKDRERHKVLSGTLENEEKKCEDLKDANQRLEGKVKNFKKMKKFKQELENINRKKLWLNYLEKAEERQSIKEQRDLAHQEIQEKQNASQPLTMAIESERRKLKNMMNNHKVLVHQLNAITTRVESKQDNFDKMKNGLQDIKDEVSHKLTALKDVEEEMNHTEVRLNQLQKNKEEVQQLVNKETNERETLSKESQTIEHNVNKLITKMNTLRESKSNKSLEIRALESQISSQERLMQNRLSYLEKIDRDAYTGTIWLREHKHLFRSDVYEPLMIEINVFNQAHALYVENSIGFQDKVAFLCTDKEDVETLSEHLCTRQGLRLNILYQDPATSKPRPKFNIEQLRRFGFNAYVDSLFSAPNPIVNYLCKQYSLHNIPVAFQNSTFNADEVPVHVFYRGDVKYNITVSRYTGNKAFKQTMIASDKSLSFCIDHGKIEMIRGQMAELQSECEGFDSQVQAVDKQIQDMRRCKTTIESKMQGLRNNRQLLMNLDGKIKNLELKLNQIRVQNAENSQEKIEEYARDKSKRLTSKIINLFKGINEDFKETSEKSIEVELDKRTVDACRLRIEPMEIEFEDIRTSLKAAEIKLQKARDALNEITGEAKYLLSKAKDISGGFTPDDEGFNQFRPIYDKLPDDISKLEVERERANTRLQCLNNFADEGELEEYEERIGLIEELEGKLTRERLELEEITANMDQHEQEWLQPLSELVESINQSFSRAFQSMGCAGEVQIFKGDDERDYQKYGICVSVTYRNGAPLQELNNVTQSGGERAVATAAYMLSMQELTPVPFRCVDEINQGMDANNERRIFDLLVDVTCQPDTSQYFFITPKLVSGLKYEPSIKIHFVHNSPFIVNQLQWNEAEEKRNR